MRNPKASWHFAVALMATISMTLPVTATVSASAYEPRIVARIPASPQSPSALPAAVGGFIPDGNMVSPIGSRGYISPSIAVTARRIISPSLQSTFSPHAPNARYITPTAWLASTQILESIDLPLGAKNAAMNGTTNVQVSAYDQATQTWNPQGSALRVDAGDNTTNAALSFVETEPPTPWVAFIEERRSLGGVEHVFAAQFYTAVNDWQITGGALNVRSDQNADHPSLIGGAIISGTEPVPWVAWQESMPGYGSQIYVSRYITPTGWQLTGQQTRAVSATLNYNLGQRNGVKPDIGFAGPGNTVPWVAWHEEGAGSPKRVYVAMGIPDNNALGGFRWEHVGSQSNCSSETACALNVDLNRDAQDVRVQTGNIPSGMTTPIPWVVFAEKDALGISQIYVRRLDGDHFWLVGGSLNVNPNRNATNPDIVFVGKTPHVAWSEETADGARRIFVKHLIDGRPGVEHWGLDTNASGLGNLVGQSGNNPTLASSGTTPYLAWQESGTLSGSGNLTGSSNAVSARRYITPTVFAAHRYPEGPAWGTTYPPFVRCIGNLSALAYSPHGICRDPLANRAAMATPSDADGAAAIAPPDNWLGKISITTTCDHVDGWRNITEIHLALYDAESGARIFLGQYVADGNRVQVEDPNNPGAFIEGVVGSGSPIETQYVTLHMTDMITDSHGGTLTPALDVEWVFSFKQPTLFKNFVQAINIVYRDQAAMNTSLVEQPEQIIESTDFFRVGSFFSGNRIFMPVLHR